ncbi:MULTISPECIES: hypothetical protein [Bacillus]|uniref:hypothetical protein n=1 Tax=Bacillus TaxID=1386 RepID=UPI0001A0059B|nr:MULTISPECIES: hypothetical protein [Bacillus]EEK77725.1 hypothetical protein bcere0009_33680 [Bacillus cereus R309803]TSI21528.1 hypothetical protein FOT98_02865 [Bacillus sp. HY001]
MSYVVINAFRDKEDNDLLYQIGEKYPKSDYKPPKKRLNELSKEHQTHKCVFIQEEKEKEE